jgi:hypothetical protein
MQRQYEVSFVDPDPVGSEMFALGSGSDGEKIICDPQHIAPMLSAPLHPLIQISLFSCVLLARNEKYSIQDEGLPYQQKTMFSPRVRAQYLPIPNDCHYVCPTSVFARHLLLRSFVSAFAMRSRWGKNY